MMEDATRLCSECNEETTWVEDHRTGDTICVSCGYIQRGHHIIVYDGSVYRSFLRRNPSPTLLVNIVVSPPYQRTV